MLAVRQSVRCLSHLEQQAEQQIPECAVSPLFQRLLRILAGQLENKEALTSTRSGLFLWPHRLACSNPAERHHRLARSHGAAQWTIAKSFDITPPPKSAPRRRHSITHAATLAFVAVRIVVTVSAFARSERVKTGRAGFADRDDFLRAADSRDPGPDSRCAFGRKSGWMPGER